jgi:phosphoglycolate phosphatase
MKPYSVIVFDWDGTLMDSTHSIVAAIQGACRDLELRVPTAAEAAWVIGLSLEPALRRAVPDLTPSMEPLFLERYRFHYLSKDTQLKLFDGVPEMLSDLQAAGATLAVATGKSRVGLNRALTATSLHSVFAATRTADETFGKPHPGMLLELIDELMVEPQQMVMIGDTSHDLTMAANAGVHGIGVAYGAHPE